MRRCVGCQTLMYLTVYCFKNFLLYIDIDFSKALFILAHRVGLDAVYITINNFIIFV